MNEMSDSRTSPHSCEHCQNVIIHETGLSLRFPCLDVEEMSKTCDFLNWTRSLPTASLSSTDQLHLFVLIDSLFASWIDEDGMLIRRDYNEGKGRMPCLHIFASDDNCAGRYIKMRPLSKFKADPGILLRCQKRLNSCMRHHIRCQGMSREFQTSIAPTRLLYIEKASSARLCEIPQGDYPAYVALSYCWGQNEHQKISQTMKANFEDRQREVNLYELPETILDAIEVTQLLEFSYIWIDALCIIQDNEQDRQKEIANMANIYRNATLTIVAACAEESTEGFLGDRKLAEAYGRLFRVPYRHSRENDEGYVLLSENPIYDTFQEPIDKRAWTMQEDILSRRVLRFGSKQTTWRCRAAWKALDGGDDPRFEFAALGNISPYRVHESQSMIAMMGQQGASAASRGWQKSIESYTHRELTNAGVRLCACAALSQTYSEIRGFKSSDYLAGLWKNEIALELLWYRPEEHWPEEYKNKNVSGPTWSWASLNVPIKFYDPLQGNQHLEDYVKVKLVSSDIIYEFDNHKYSGVKSGRLWLNGVLQKAYWDGCCLRRSEDSCEILPVKISWDVAMEFLPLNIWCLEIIGSHISLGLVLTRDCNELEFRRVGLFESLDWSEFIETWFNEVKRQITAVY